jgi:hypothetical protein
VSPLYPGGPTLPREVFVSEAGGGVLVDVDGNSLIDFGSGDSSARVLTTAAPEPRNCRWISASCRRPSSGRHCGAASPGGQIPDRP